MPRCGRGGVARRRTLPPPLPPFCKNGAERSSSRRARANISRSVATTAAASIVSAAARSTSRSHRSRSSASFSVATLASGSSSSQSASASALRVRSTRAASRLSSLCRIARSRLKRATFSSRAVAGSHASAPRARERLALSESMSCRSHRSRNASYMAETSTSACSLAAASRVGARDANSARYHGASAYRRFSVGTSSLVSLREKTPSTSTRATAWRIAAAPDASASASASPDCMRVNTSSPRANAAASGRSSADDAIAQIVPPRARLVATLIENCPKSASRDRKECIRTFAACDGRRGRGDQQLLAV